MTRSTFSWRGVAPLGILLALSGCASTASVVGTLQPPPASGPATPERAGNPSLPVSQSVIYVEQVPARHHRTPLSPAVTRTVVQTRDGFAPPVLVVPAGTQVVFRNDDAVYHSVFSRSPARPFDTGMYKPGQRTRPVRFEQPGVVQLFCSLDATMSGFVVVLPHDCFTRPDRNGAFSLAGLPPATYTIRAWHPMFGSTSRRVDLARGHTARLTLQFPGSQPHAER